MSAVDMIPGADASSDIGERFIAMHTFESTDDDDLTFQKGDIIIATDTDGEWWEGRLERDGTGGETGSFPHNYVARAPPLDGPSPPPDAPPSEETRLVAQHNFHSDQDGDLSFDKGDVLLGAELNGEWWTGTNPKTGKSGDFPANYVKKAPATTAASVPTASVAAASSANTAATPQPAIATTSAPTRLVALHDFNSKEDGDLAFKKGAILIGTELNGDWWEGRHEANGKTGSFPKNYVTGAPVVEQLTANKEEDDARNRTQAATKIQAMHRGRAGRKKAARKRKEEERIRLGKEKRARAANAKHDSGGWNEAKEGGGGGAVRENAKLGFDDEETKRTAAATKIQALQRGKKGRAKARRKRAEMERLRRAREHEAATKIQAVQRGRMSRNRYGRQQKKGASDEKAAEMQREEADWDDSRVLPLKPEITRDALERLFQKWDLDDDGVLTMEEIRKALEKQDEERAKKAEEQQAPEADDDANNDISLPRLQTARLRRHFERNQEEHMNLDYHYWDLGEFIEMTQTPLTDEKWSSKKSMKKVQKRWAPKVEEFEDDEGNMRYRHTTGSKPRSKDAFIEMYHGTEEWDKAMVKISPSDAKKRQLRMRKKMKTQGVSSMLSLEKFNQIRLRLKQRCTTHRGLDVGNVMPRKRWPVDRDAEPDAEGNQPRLPVTYEKMKDAMKVASSGSTSLDDKEFAGFWGRLPRERDDCVTYEEFTQFVQYKPRNTVRKRRSVDMSAAAQTSNFSSGFRPDNNDKSTGAFVSKSKTLESKDVNPVFLSFQRHVKEADFTEALLQEHFNVFDKDGDGTITREEFRIGFESLGIPHKQADLDLIVDVLDMNNDDVIDYNEFTEQLFKDPRQIFQELNQHKADQQKKRNEDAARRRADGQLIEGATAPDVPESELMEREDLEQIRLRLRQDCSTHKGIEVAEVFPHRKWPGKGPLGHVSYAEMRKHMRKRFPNRLGADDKWAYPSFWFYLCTEDRNNCTKDEFARFTSEQPADGKRYMRKKSIVLETSGQIAGFSNSFRPDINASAAKSKEMKAKKNGKERSSHRGLQREAIKNELTANWASAPQEKLAAAAAETAPTPSANAVAGSKFGVSGGSISANLKAAAFGKKIMNLKFARKFGDNKLDEDEVRLIKNKIRAASYKKGGANLEQLFAEWDKDKNKFLDYDELALAVAKLLPKKSMLSKQEMMQLCKKFDNDGDGLVSVAEFKAFLSESAYKSRRKKRSEMEVKEFTSHASLVNSVTGMFRGAGAAASKLKLKVKKKEQPKRALWRKKRSDSEDSAADATAATGTALDARRGPIASGRESQASYASNTTDVSTATQYEGGGYDMMGRKIPVVVIPGKRSRASVDLANALKTIPQEKAPSLPGDSNQGGSWFCNSDSAPSEDSGDEGEEGEMMIDGDGARGDSLRNNNKSNNAHAHSAPRMTPIIKHRMRRQKKVTASVLQYQSSWDEPVNKTGNVNPESDGTTMRSTKTSGRFPVKMTRNAERNSQWFTETNAGASSLTDTGSAAPGNTAPSSRGGIDMTLYRRKWNEQQPGDGSVNNPWRVGVKTSWTGEIAAPTWPTKKGTWVFVPNPPSREAKRGALPDPFGKNKKGGGGGGITRGAHGPESSPNQKHRGIIDTAPKVKPKVTYHAMERLNRGIAGGNSPKYQSRSGHEQPWNSSLELRVPERPPAFDQNWPKRLEQSVDPDDEDEVARRREEEQKVKLEARQLAPRQITRINSPRVQ